MSLLALCLHRPWDQSIFQGPKRWENRTWERRSLINKYIALHAGQKWDAEAVKFMAKLGYVPPLDEATSPAQAIVGVVRIRCMITVSQDELFFAQAQDPYMFGPKAWGLDDIQALKNPIPCKGHQGLWQISPEQEGRVRAQVVIP